jgi:hypothetical protein
MTSSRVGELFQLATEDSVVTGLPAVLLKKVATLI